ncbi:MAG TPA: sugar phosphate nucleotidyltransferase [Candidatus Elarobacter sp.]|nr:sugar phosphate nucleotidyltransferase [Candidatus Elarobacter sp.]
MLPLAILCGGLGTRMRPHTLRVPKPLIEVCGEPFLAHLLRSVARQGVRDVVLLVGYLGQMIVDAVGDGAAFGLRVRYSFDGERQLGTAGAVRLALPLLGERFLVTFGDAYLDVDYAEVVRAFEAAGTAGLMTVYRWDGAGETRPNAALGEHGARVTRYDKEARPPDVQYVDYGLSAFRADAFGELPPGEPADLGYVNRRLIAANQLAAYVVETLPSEVGSPAGLAETERRLRLPS